jgi:hypothetical protein
MAQPISEGYFLPWSPLPFPTESFSRVPETPAILLFGGVLVWNANAANCKQPDRRLPLGYEAREWAFRRDRSQQ